MINNKITEGVGKKIVEALKQQNDIEITPVTESFEQPLNQHFTQSSDVTSEDAENALSKSLQEAVASVDLESARRESQSQTFNFSQIVHPQTQTQSQIPNQDTFYNQSFTSQPVSSTPDLSAVEEMELPSNVAVLKQLITKLPSGVSKHTGAMIIKQTMEALGISMNSVLQEAQQVQENLNHSARECQNTILEYKKQINILEAQTQKYQRQFAAVNDIISLFIQTN